MPHPDHKPARPLAEMPELGPTVIDHYRWLEPVEDEGRTYLVAPRACDRCWEHPLDYIHESVDAAIRWKAEWLADELDIEADPDELAAIEAEADGWVLVAVHHHVFAPDVVQALTVAAENR